ncbi:M3 family metallopeptidase [Novosphingobium cyanobacteriorum]|uniref:M3 family metallopeptidase n=1 Tax=Novosphingobium cyanobacteriorum TaxID=3024215 RepID=A0ABT6CGX2_9SPHN|nr:M3 family metallopeptidase [Novosphingobium cyanobacteriorum]MDF8332325.1 M3 family metallopeptidase [Novosphingobium cyanobacteriorum]
MRFETNAIRAAAMLLAGSSLAGCAGQMTQVQTTPVPTAAPAPAPAPAIPTGTSAFAKPSALPFELPDFNAYTPADYQAGHEEGIVIARAEVAAITANAEAPTFANTIEALETSRQVLKRAQRAFSAVHAADTSDALDAVETTTAAMTAAWDSEFYLNGALFARIKALHDARATLGLTPEQDRVLEMYYQDFVLKGALLNQADKAKLAQIDTQLATLSSAFGQKLTAATKDAAVVVDNPQALAGLSTAEIAAAAEAAKARGLTGKWLLGVTNTTVQPQADALADRALREKVFMAGWTRATKGDANDTRTITAQVLALRAEKAKLLGYPSYAAWNLQDQMARSPDKVTAFLDALDAPTAKAVARDAVDIRAAIKAKGGKFEPRPWDWKRYAEDVRKKKFAFDSSEAKPYFETWRVLEDGVFHAATQLYGITFHRREDLKGWRPEMRVYEVHEEDGSTLGLFLIDPFQRDTKQGGAWMDTVVPGSPLFGTKPVVYNVLNIAPPAPGQPALATDDDVITLFHEFGHALHGLFAAGGYPRVASTTDARDFVEFPSQFNEHWAFEPSVLAHYAKHWKTGAPMPPALAAKIVAAGKFDKAFDTASALAAMQLDMKAHVLAPGQTPQDVDAFEAQALKETGLPVDMVPTRYRVTSFRHVFGGGYAAGYYAYEWTKMLEADAYQWFLEHGGMTRANGQRFRELVLAKGDREPLDQVWLKFRGREPQVGPMLEQLGLDR